MIDQIALAVLGISSAFLVHAKTDRVRRWSAITGLLAQPFWYYTFIVNNQWGAVLLTCFYLASWVKAFWQYWLVPLRANRERV